MKRYFAERCPYGIDTVCEGDAVISFPTEESRDRYVDWCNDDDFNPVACAIDWEDARKYLPGGILRAETALLGDTLKAIGL